MADRWLRVCHVLLLNPEYGVGYAFRLVFPGGRPIAQAADEDRLSAVGAPLEPWPDVALTQSINIDQNLSKYRQGQACRIGV
jgi:hypothetical protein